MKLYSFEFAFDFFKIPQIVKHVLLLRSTFVIKDFDQYSMLLFQSHFFDYFWAEISPFRLHFDNDESWLSQKYTVSILQTFHKVKSHSQKFDFIMLFPSLALTTPN